MSIFHLENPQTNFSLLPFQLAHDEINLIVKPYLASVIQTCLSTPKRILQICPKLSPKLGSGALGDFPLANYPEAKITSIYYQPVLEDLPILQIKFGYTLRSRH